MRILGLAGSLRARSYNAALLRAAAQLAPKELQVEIGGLGGIPLYDGDVEAADGIPRPVEALKARIRDTDGLLLVTPEYNHGIPGVFKNAVDWLSRPPADLARVFGGRPVGVIGATPGRGATSLAQAAWLPVLHTLGARIYTGRSVRVAGAGSVFDDDLALIDEAVRRLLEQYMAGFAAFVGEVAGRRG